MRPMVLAALSLLALAGCQGAPTSDQVYAERFGNQPCSDRANDAGLCAQPSNFNLFGTIITGERQP
ncbi:MAG: hypothetical protein JNL61_02095 [Rhizobiaceae bacterium]|nr:hypothetical protein [Rhizobiaceae bacterium]